MAAAARPALTRDERRARLHGVYAIINEGARDPLELAHAALDAGVRILQYRAKSGIVPERVNVLRGMTRESGALLLLNDDARAVAALDCDGVHLGPDDAGFTDPKAVRAVVGDRLIGLSCGTLGEARNAERGGADYLGVGSVYATESKADAGPPIGIAELGRICAATQLPVAAIGGVRAERVPEVADAGAAMVAVLSALADVPDAFAAASELVRAWGSR